LFVLKYEDSFKRYVIPWDAWHEDEHSLSQPIPIEGMGLDLPEAWDVHIVDPNQTQPASIEMMVQALENPIGTPALEVMAKNDIRTVAIAVDDLTRPACVQSILELLVDKLEACGINKEQIRIIIGVGLHGPVEGQDVVRKLGRRISGIQVVNHDAKGELATCTLANGKSVTINRMFMLADLKIVIGTVMPHLYAGFSGGAKMIIPGLAGIDTIASSHKSALMGLGGKLRQIEGNLFRERIEAVAKVVGPVFSIQLVVDSQRQIARVFAGDIISSHRAAVQYAEKLYISNFPKNLDVIILNAYPKDTELLQIENAFIAYRTASNLVKDGGVVVVTAACSHGMGRHGLFEPGMPLYFKPQAFRFLGDRRLIVYSPGVTADDFHALFWDKYSFHRQWPGVVDELKQKYPTSCAVGIIPCASLQMSSH
jgi:lactate racemase